MRIGILGLPQSGKRTLFTLLTGRKVPESRRPDESIEGVAPIRDPRVDKLESICKPERKVYAENNFVLLPDIDPGAAKREWLEAARRCDLLCMVVRAFESEAVYHPKGSVDAKRDRATLASELIFADMELADTRLQRLAREAKAGPTREQKLQKVALEKALPVLEAERPMTEVELDEEELTTIRGLNMLTFKPTLWTYNVSEEGLSTDFGAESFAISALMEAEIDEIEDPAERQEFFESMGVSESGLNRMNAAAYDALGLMSFYTIGTDEARAWTIRKGAFAPAAGGKVHSDIERGFIRVEIIKYDDLIAAGSEKAAKEKGKVSVKGRDYVIEDGDICHFLFNV
jgi:ribosome-binding ATPase